MVHEAKIEMRTEFIAMLNRKVVLLEAHVEAKANEIRQDTTSTLDKLKSIVVAVGESQDKMWPAIEGISKEVQGLVQWDVGTDGGEDTKPVPTSVNLAEEEPVPTVKHSMHPQSNPMMIGPTPFKWLSGIPEVEEEIDIVKDSITSRLLA